MIGPSHTLLIVDDEPSILAALRRTLRGESYRILTTSDPSEALGIIEREHVDLMISDIDMPKMSGLELVAHVRHSFPEVVRILLTGRGSLETAMRAINDGEVYRFLTKPWNDAELRETIHQAVQRLEELRRAATAEKNAIRRRQLMAELEREHPGISAVARGDNGVYVLDERRVETLASQLDAPDLRKLLGR